MMAVVVAPASAVNAPMLDSLSAVFYDPWVFWGVPLALALAWTGLRHVGNRLRRLRR